MNKKFEMVKVHPKFKEELQEIRIKRLASGVDNKLKSFNRLTQALLRHPKYPDIKQDMIKARFLEDNKGQVFNIFVFIIVSFITVLFCAGLIYVSGLMNTVFTNVGAQNEVNAGQAGYSNMTYAAENTFGKMDSSIQALRLVALSIVFSMIIGIFISNAFMNVHPAFFILYVFIVMLAVFFSAPVSNAYQSLLTSDIFGGNLVTFTPINWIMINLPIVVSGIGLLGAVLLFVNLANRGRPKVLI